MVQVAGHLIQNIYGVMCVMVNCGAFVVIGFFAEISAQRVIKKPKLKNKTYAREVREELIESQRVFD